MGVDKKIQFLLSKTVITIGEAAAILKTVEAYSSVSIPPSRPKDYQVFLFKAESLYVVVGRKR